jgi:endoglucanase
VKSLRDRICELAEQVLNCPTAPFREDAVRRFIRDFCAQRDIRVKQDDVGNLIAVYGPAHTNTVFAFSAHMDHPGFIAERDSRKNILTALFYGGVEEKYFVDAKVRFFTASGSVKGIVTRTQSKTAMSGHCRRVQVQVSGRVKRGDMGMWDLPAYRIRGDRLYSRACDDVVGCASVLALLDELHRRKVHKQVMAAFTVAEEAGLHGAKYLCVAKGIPLTTRLVAIETSSVLPNVHMGDGVVIRVGDRKSIFTPGLTDFLMDCAQKMKAQDESFRYQRKLMDAGTCESTVYNQFGFVNAAVCIPLGNYHNRDVRRGRIAAEYVSVSDLENMVKLFLSIVENSKRAESFLGPKAPAYKRQDGSLGEFFYE